MVKHQLWLVPAHLWTVMKGSEQLEFYPNEEEVHAQFGLSREKQSFKSQKSRWAKAERVSRKSRRRGVVSQIRFEKVDVVSSGYLSFLSLWSAENGEIWKVVQKQGQVSSPSTKNELDSRPRFNFTHQVDLEMSDVFVLFDNSFRSLLGIGNGWSDWRDRIFHATSEKDWTLDLFCVWPREREWKTKKDPGWSLIWMI